MLAIGGNVTPAAVTVFVVHGMVPFVKKQVVSPLTKNNYASKTI